MSLMRRMALEGVPSVKTVGTVTSVVVNLVKLVCHCYIVKAIVTSDISYLSSPVDLSQLPSSVAVRLDLPPNLCLEDDITPYGAVMSQQRELVKPGDFVEISSTGRNVSAVNCFLHACKKHLVFYIVTYALLFIYHRSNMLNS